MPGKVINHIIRIRYLTFFQSGKQRLGRIQISDFVIKIGKEVYLLECQSYDDGSMAIRIAEYAFIVARQFAAWDIGHATIPMPRFSIIYIKRTEKTPKITRITFTFPDGQEMNGWQQGE